MFHVARVSMCFVVVSFSVFAQGLSPQLTIQEIREKVTHNASVLDNLQYDFVLTFVDTNSQSSQKNIPSRTETLQKPMIARGHWVSTKSGKFVKEFYKSGVLDSTPSASSTLYGFNGKDLRVLQRDPEGKEFGQFNNAQEAKLQFDRSGHETEVNRANGLNVAGRSLREWIDQPEAQMLPEEKLGEAVCCVVFVPKGDDGKRRTYDGLKFYLDKGKSCAVVSLCYMSGKTVIAKNVNTEFLEISPGFWFAVKGYRDPVGVLAQDAKPLPVVNFEVSNLAVNSQIPDEVFEPDFKRGTEVRDLRAGFSVTYVWGDGQGTPKKVLESLGDVLDASAQADGSSIAKGMPTASQSVTEAEKKRTPRSPEVLKLCFAAVAVTMLIVVTFLVLRLAFRRTFGRQDR